MHVSAAVSSRKPAAGPAENMRGPGPSLLLTRTQGAGAGGETEPFCPGEAGLTLWTRGGRWSEETEARKGKGARRPAQAHISVARVGKEGTVILRPPEPRKCDP